MSRTNKHHSTTVKGFTPARRAAVAGACALVVVALTTAAGPAQAKRPDLEGRAVPAAHSEWTGEQNMAVRHAEMTVAWRLGLGG